MMRICLSVLSLFIGAALSASSLLAAPLVTVGQMEVQPQDLELAVASSPYATQFNAMDPDEQAALRGDLLKRLVTSRLLLQEAQRLGLDQDAAFQKDMESFRRGRLYRYYMDKLRERLEIPEQVQQELKQQYTGEADALTAARSAYLADRYRTLRNLTIQRLAEEQQAEMHLERIQPTMKPDTVLMSLPDLQVRYADLVDLEAYPTPPNPEWIRQQLYTYAEVLLVSRAAEKEGVDISRQLHDYRVERLPAMLLERKQREWLADPEQQKAFLRQHPDIARIPERWHLGQLVVADRAFAEQLRKRILAGESLFRLAGELSIDPYGRQRNGDMGWVVEGSGMPQIEQAIVGLQDGELSEVIETPRGYHLVTILERRPGRSLDFEAVRDRVAQAMINERLADYLKTLQEHFPVQWHLLEKPAT